jgi:hypothetical protein
MITILSIKAEVLCPSIIEILSPVETSLMVCVPVAPILSPVVNLLTISRMQRFQQ